MMTMKLIERGWTREDTPEAVIYTKPGCKPLVFARREMRERGLEVDGGRGLRTPFGIHEGVLQSPRCEGTAET